MIGKCPQCGISLKDPPFGGRNRNEVLLTLRYREVVEHGDMFKEMEELGYCELCEATREDLEMQKSSGVVVL
jgi:hypothetical protein